MNRVIKIPVGTSAGNVKFENGLITVEYQYDDTESIDDFRKEPEFIPKDGDFCTLRNEDRVYYFIYKNKNNFFNCYYYYARYYKSLLINNTLVDEGILTNATESEKQILLSEIDKAGFVWNAEKKRIEKKRWRAEKKCNYYILHTDMDIFNPTETKNILDDMRYDSGNYFKTEEQATEAGELIKELLFHYHEQDDTIEKLKKLLK